jgi:hypothetical protein
VKVFVEAYSYDDYIYTCITGKGKEIFVDIYANSDIPVLCDPAVILGQRFKLKNKSESLRTRHGTYFFPKDSEWYPLRDKTPIVDCEKFFD